MRLKSLPRSEIRRALFQVMDQVRSELHVKPDVDDFLDHTALLDDWEEALPEEEYPIFVMAVLNDIRKEAIVKVIVDSVLGTQKEMKKTSGKIISSEALQQGHPFC